MIVKLPCDECEGTMVGDVSGAGNNGTLIGDPIFDANTGIAVTFLYVLMAWMTISISAYLT